MEKAIFIRGAKELNKVSPEYSRLYFGNEFCERLLPPKRELDEVISFAKKKGLGFTYVTPYVTDKGLNIVKDNVAYISRKFEIPEVVINDWGVLRILKSYTIKPVLGRLLTKMKRGPRILNAIGKYPEEMIEHFRRSGMEVQVFQEFLARLGINRAEFDNVLQGISMDFKGSKIRASVYYPYPYITTTRRCLSNSCDIISKRDIIGIYPCNKECLKYTVELSHDAMPRKIILKGNSQFLRNEELPEGLENKGFDRLVYQPEIII